MPVGGLGSPAPRRWLVVLEVAGFVLPLALYGALRVFAFSLDHRLAFAAALLAQAALGAVLVRRLQAGLGRATSLAPLTWMLAFELLVFVLLVGIGKGALPASVVSLTAGWLALALAGPYLSRPSAPERRTELRPQPRRAVSRPRSRGLPRAMLLTFRALALLLIALVSIQYLDPGGERHAVAADAPSRAQLDRAIASAESYIDGLYGPTTGSAATVSEYYAVPLRLRVGPGRWLLPGEEAVTVSEVAQGFATESARVDFDLPADGSRLSVRYAVDWRGPGDRIEVRVEVETMRPAQAQGGAPGRGVELFLGPKRLAVWDDARVGDHVQFSFPAGKAPVYMRSLRYTLRHVGQLALAHYLYRGRRERVEKLAETLSGAGYQPGEDIYMALFGPALPSAASLSFSAQGYPDCAMAEPGPTFAAALPPPRRSAGCRSASTSGAQPAISSGRRSRRSRACRRKVIPTGPTRPSMRSRGRRVAGQRRPSHRLSMLRAAPACRVARTGSVRGNGSALPGPPRSDRWRPSSATRTATRSAGPMRIDRRRSCSRSRSPAMV